jgi:hypothetical protein
MLSKIDFEKLRSAYLCRHCNDSYLYKLTVSRGLEEHVVSFQDAASDTPQELLELGMTLNKLMVSCIQTTESPPDSVH